MSQIDYSFVLFSVRCSLNNVDDFCSFVFNQSNLLASGMMPIPVKVRYQ